MVFVEFNQNRNCICVGAPTGFRIYKCNPFELCFESTEGGIGRVEMLFCTSLVALVGAGEHVAFSPRRLRLLNTATRSYICDLNFVTTVINVKMNASRLVAVLENRMHIFDLKTMKILHTLHTPPNPNGIVALAQSEQSALVGAKAKKRAGGAPTVSGESFMALPASESKGEILIYDTIALKVVTSISAHKSSVQCIAFNRDGTLIATASTQGTVIRVFSVFDGSKICTFRRGSRPVTVCSLAFNYASTLLAVASNSTTIHLFDVASASRQGMGEGRRQRSSTDPGNVGVNLNVSQQRIKDKVKGVIPDRIIGLLPNAVCDVVEPQRKWASITLKDSLVRGGGVVCAFGMETPKDRGTLMVLSSKGYFSRYRVPDEGREGGASLQCKLLSEHSLRQTTSEHIGAKLHGCYREVAARQAAAEVRVVSAKDNKHSYVTEPPSPGRNSELESSLLSVVEDPNPHPFTNSTQILAAPLRVKHDAGGTGNPFAMPYEPRGGAGEVKEARSAPAEAATLAMGTGLQGSESPPPHWAGSDPFSFPSMGFGLDHVNDDEKGRGPFGSTSPPFSLNLNASTPPTSGTPGAAALQGGESRISAGAPLVLGGGAPNVVAKVQPLMGNSAGTGGGAEASASPAKLGGDLWSAFGVDVSPPSERKAGSGGAAGVQGLSQDQVPSPSNQEAGGEGATAAGAKMGTCSLKKLSEGMAASAAGVRGAENDQMMGSLQSIKSSPSSTRKISIQRVRSGDGGGSRGSGDTKRRGGGSSRRLNSKFKVAELRDSS